ncbi:ribosome maturation factor RimP [Synergistales bacterium]|nr:ribosome maturation factor RimP [Synergistales bacterium]
MNTENKETDVLFKHIEDIVTTLGYECVNVALTSERGQSILRVLIDTLGGITVSDCETVSGAVSRFLDDSSGADAQESYDAAKWLDRYYLEVSSPGLERPLFKAADYERFKGKEARVRTAELLDGHKTHVGRIYDSGAESVTLLTEEGLRVIPFEQILRASLVFSDLKPKKPKVNTKKRAKNQTDKVSHEPQENHQDND